MKLNCDLGEGFGEWQMANDHLIMPNIDMANIACGFHASDPKIITKTIGLAKKFNVMIGAHPGYPDLQGFGRRKCSYSSDELISIILYQIGALQALCIAQQTDISYVKPHGALYNQMMEDLTIFTSIVSALTLFSVKLPLMIMAMPANKKKSYLAIAEKYEIDLLFEAFADRAYDKNSLLVPRSKAGSCYDQLEDITIQAKQIIKNKPIKSYDGKLLNIEADSICIHSDNPLAVSACQAISSLLQEQ